MLGKGAVQECFVGRDESVDVAACSICSKPVHHICSIGVYEGELNVRVCSLICSDALGGKGQHSRSLPGKSKSTGKRARNKSGSGGERDGSASDEGAVIPKKKFYFTPANDLALLKKVLSVCPFAEDHGQKGERYATVTDNLNDHLASKCERSDSERSFFSLSTSSR